jgi:glycosyltransferase involved in cell wall biosynthesis
VIGVVIPCRDGADYLAEALQSIAAQGVPHAVVVADDGSTDGGAELARAHGARVVRSPAPGSGPAAARRAGVAAVDTELLAFLDADDRWLPGKLAAQRAALDADPGLDAVVGGVRHFLSPDREAALAGRVVLPPDQPVARLFGTLLIRRSAWDRVARDGADLDDTLGFFTAARRMLSIGTLSGIVLERRIHGANWTMQQRDRLHADYLRAARAAIVARRSERP